MNSKSDSKYVIGIKSKELNFKSLANLAILLDKMDFNTKSIALDLKEVESVTEDFFTFVKNFSETTKLTLLNIPSELFAMLNLRRYDKNVKMFNNNLDFFEDKRELVNRKFHLVK
ncbi:MAG: hypothetical protein ACI37S_08245 [Candidatus Gastranaerophilaceae bacterium]